MWDAQQRNDGIAIRHVLNRIGPRCLSGCDQAVSLRSSGRPDCASVSPCSGERLQEQLDLGEVPSQSRSRPTWAQRDRAPGVRNLPTFAEPDGFSVEAGRVVECGQAGESGEDLR